MKFNKTFASMAAAAALLAAPLASQAAPTLRLSDLDVNTDALLSQVTVTDQGGGDVNPAQHVVTFVGKTSASSAWSSNVSTGTGDGATPFDFGIDLNSVNTTSSGAGKMRIEFSEDNLTSITGSTRINGDIGGTIANGGSLTYSIFVDAGNSLFGGSLIWSGTTLGPGGFSDLGSAYSNLSGPFSMTLVVDIVHSTGGTTSFDFFGSVPEPGSFALAGLALLGLGLARRRQA